MSYAGNYFGQIYFGQNYPNYLVTSLSINSFDIITITESRDGLLSISVNINENIISNEDINVNTQLADLSISDNVILNENINSNASLADFNISENLVLYDSNNTNLSLGDLNLNENIALNENNLINTSLGDLSINENIQIADYLNLIMDVGTLSVADYVNLISVITPEHIYNINSIDSIHVDFNTNIESFRFSPSRQRPLGYNGAINIRPVGGVK